MTGSSTSMEIDLRDVHLARPPGSFDYTSIDPNLVADVHQAELSINASKRQHVLEVGRALLKVKALLPHGQFSDWLDRAVQFTPRTAQNYMRVADVLAGKNETVSLLPPTTLYRLARAPASIRERIADRIEAGEIADRVTVEDEIATARRRAAEAKKPAEQVKKEAAKRKRAEERDRKHREQCGAWDEQYRRRKEAAASELIHGLSMNFEHDDMAKLIELFDVAGGVEARAALKRLSAAFHNGGEA